MSNLVANPIQIFLDNSGNALNGGSIYVGTPNTNPVTNPITVYQDEAMSIPMPQPLQTINGMISLNGSPRAVYLAATSYSLLVQDSNGNTVLSRPVCSTLPDLSPSGTVLDDLFVNGTDFTAGTSNTLTLSSDPGSIANLFLYFDGTYQDRSNIQSYAFPIVILKSVIPLGVNHVSAKGGATLPIGTPAAGSVSDATVAQGSKLYNRINDIVDVRDKGAVGDGVADDTAAFNAALATGKMVYAPSGTYKITATLNIIGPGIRGDGETTNIQRAFTGGRLLAYPGGNPIYLRDFQLSTASSITVANGDTGLDIGFTSAWAGRGEIANLLISGQWDGFKWTAGTAGPIINVQCLNNLGNGFYGINPRMEFYDCLSQANAGNGYYIITTTSGQTGVSFTRCGTFANQGYGFIFTANPGITGANVNLVASGTSFDGQGGIFFQTAYLQIWMSQVLAEYSGFASEQVPGFSGNGDAVGIQLGLCTNVTGTDIQSLNNAGAGILLDSCVGVALANVLVLGNGTGAQGGAHQVGILFNSNNVGVVITGLIANIGPSQLVDISFGGGNDVNLVAAVFRTYFSAETSTVRFIGRETSASNAIPSAANVTALDYYDFQSVTGTTNITNIYGSLYPGRTVSFKFNGALTIQNTGNILLTAPITTVLNQIVTLVTDGTYWYGK